MTVEVALEVLVGVDVGVLVMVLVGGTVGAKVGVAERVAVLVIVGVADRVAVLVAVGEALLVGVGDNETRGVAEAVGVGACVDMAMKSAVTSAFSVPVYCGIPVLGDTEYPESDG